LKKKVTGGRGGAGQGDVICNALALSNLSGGKEAAIQKGERGRTTEFTKGKSKRGAGEKGKRNAGHLYNTWFN